MRWRRNPQVLWRIAPQYLVLAMVDGRTLEVGGAGADIWGRLTEWVTEDDLIAALAEHFAAEGETLSTDVQSLLRELHVQGYVDCDR